MIDIIIKETVAKLENINLYLDKATEHAASKKYDVNNLLQARLAPDQYPFVKQVQVACDNAKGMAARLAGKSPPVHEDTEKTVQELRARVAKTVAFVKSIPAADYKGWEERACDIPWAPGKFMVGTEYLTQLALPNYYFHLVTAYSILRANGVDLGKTDFMTPVNMREKK